MAYLLSGNPRCLTKNARSEREVAGRNGAIAGDDLVGARTLTESTDGRFRTRSAHDHDADLEVRAPRRLDPACLVLRMIGDLRSVARRLVGIDHQATRVGLA